MKDEQDALEGNVSTLLEAGGARPQIARPAKARIRAELIARHGVAKRRWLVVAGLGMAAAVAAATVLWLVSGPGKSPSSPSSGNAPEIAGAEIVRGPDSMVTVLGPRQVRVTGAVLIEVTPGHGAFTVETAAGRIDVLGTRFLVDAAPGRTTAAVVRGEVVLATTAGDLVLHAGEQGVAAPGHVPVRGPAPRLSHLASWAREARQHDAQAVHHGTLFARDPGLRSHPPWGAEYPLPIARLGVDVVVEDQVARVALDQTFHNDQPQTLEGVYRFAIPPDAALQRLAMYVDGKLVESGVVERMAARRIYEELVYRRVDPALLEWAGTGRLSLRVYPIPALQDKRLMIAYTQSLPSLYRDYTLAVPLPEVEAPVGVLDVAVRVKGCAGCELSSTSHQITVSKDGADAVVRYQRSGVKLGDTFVLRVRDARGAAQVAEATQDGERYLRVRAPAELGGQPVAYRPRTWVILDDVSASRSQLELAAQRDVIDGLLHELDERDRVAIVAFDVEARVKLAMTQVIDADRQAVRRALAGEGGVGATDLGKALDAAMPLLANVAPDDASVIYLGDGVVTSGARNLDALRARLVGRARFIGVGVGDGPDTQTLQGLAGATGGYATTIDLADDLAWRTFDLVSALHTQRVVGLTARLLDAGGQDVAAQAYLGAQQLADGEEVELVAKLGASTPAALELRGSLNGQPWQKRIDLAAAAHHGDAGYLPRLWAQRHIAARLLAKHEPVAVPSCDPKHACPSEAEAREARDEAIRREVVALGKRYFLLSRHTSLLVLENDAMYAQYGVAKGSGETWAPYAMPSTIPVVTTPLTAAAADPGDELVRSPVQIFYEMNPRRDAHLRTGEPENKLEVRSEFSLTVGLTERIHDVASEGAAIRATKQAVQPPAATASVESSAKADDKPVPAAVFNRRAATEKRESEASHVGGLLGSNLQWPMSGMLEPVVSTNSLSHLLRYAQPSDPGFDDLSGFVPALFDDAADAWRARLAEGSGSHTLDPAAAQLLIAARAAIPAGVYHWNGVEIAVDAAHRFAWRRTTDAGLDELAVFDGSAWRRRYPELGVEAVRSIDKDDVALGLGYFPLWIAEPAHYAAAYDVALRGAREVVLSRRVHDQPVVQLVLAFDDRARLVSITGAQGEPLVELTWASGLASARLGGEPISVSYAAQPVDNAVHWLPATDVMVSVELPLRPVAYWDAKLAALPAGHTERLAVARQRLVSLVATNHLAAVWPAYQALGSLGMPGDVVLASSGIVRAPASELGALDGSPIGRYLAAARGFHRGAAERVATSTQAQRDALPPGLIRSLWSLRASVAFASEQHNKSALAHALAIGPRAPLLQMIGAAAILGVERAQAWDALSTSTYRNSARVMAVNALFRYGRYQDAYARAPTVVEQLDLSVPPPRIDGVEGFFDESPEGRLRGRMMWSMWRDRVQTAGSFEHVMALIAAKHDAPPGELSALLDRAADLAGNDLTRMIQVALQAASMFRWKWAEDRLRPVVVAHPSHAGYQLLASLELSQKRLADALLDLEAAQAAADAEALSDEVRGYDLYQIVDIAQRLATDAPSPAAIQRAVTWAGRWRAIEPDNAAIDDKLGEMFLALGDAATAWRYLSTAIDRDPWSGAGYERIAETLEHQGKLAESLEYWQLAVIIDQTDPTPRLRKALALAALGRSAERDALLHEIVQRKWHPMWDGIVLQAQALLDGHR